MRKKQVLAPIVAIALLAAMTGCSQTTTMPKPANQSSSTTSSSTPTVSGTAAVIGDVSISEQQVADYIAQYRMFINKSDDVDWATFLDESGTTAEAVRDAAIQHFAENAAVEKRAAELGIEATETEIAEAVSEMKELSGDAGNASSWKSLLETSGYDEDGYEEDIKLNILKTKLCAQEGGIHEATDPEMLAAAAASPSSYTGKEFSDLAYPASGSYAASAFLSENEGADLKKFLSAAQSAVDSGAAANVSSEHWSCLEDISATASQALSELKVGDMGRFVDDDGSVHVVLVTAEYMSKANGSFLLNEMPEPIKARLKSDVSSKNRAAAMTSYLERLVADMDLDKKTMPSGLPYDVSLSNSEYGEQKTRAEQDAEAQNLIENQLDELENAGADTQEAYDNLQNIIDATQAKKDNTNGD